MYDRTIRVLSSENSIYWQVFYTKLSRGYNYPIDYDSKKESWADKVISLSTLEESQLPAFLLEKIVIQSEFDKTVIIDQDHWAMTLINTGDNWIGHAVIAIEGVDKTTHFFRYIHITADGGYISTHLAIIHDSGPVTYKRTHKGTTQTWLRTKEKVERLIQRVEIEQKFQSTPHAFIYLNVTGPITGIKPVKIAEFDSMEELGKIFFVAEGLVSHKNVIFISKRAASAKWFEMWMGEKHSLFLRHKISGTSLVNGKGCVEVFSVPDNCLSYAIKKLYYASIDLDYGMVYPAADPNTFINKVPASSSSSSSSSTFLYNAEKGQEKLVIPFWIEQTSEVFRADFTDEVQKIVGRNKVWKLSQETVTQLDQWRWYPALGVGSTSRRSLRIDKKTLFDDKGIIFITDMKETLERGETNDEDGPFFKECKLSFSSLPTEMISSLISIEEVLQGEKSLTVVIETDDGKRLIDLKEACLRQFIELEVHTLKIESCVKDVWPLASSVGRMCLIS